MLSTFCMTRKQWWLLGLAYVSAGWSRIYGAEPDQRPPSRRPGRGNYTQRGVTDKNMNMLDRNKEQTGAMEIKTGFPSELALTIINHVVAGWSGEAVGACRFGGRDAGDVRGGLPSSWHSPGIRETRISESEQQTFNF